MKNLLTWTVTAVFCLMFAGCAGACVDDGKVKRAVEKQGYSDVKIKSKHIVAVKMRGCSEEDAAAYKVRAVNAKNKEVDLIVCADWPWKGVTIRTK